MLSAPGEKKLLTRTLTAFALGGLLISGPATAQDAPDRQQVSAYPKPTEFPNANAAAVARHFNRARIIAGNDLEVLSWARPMCSAKWTCNVNAF